MRMELIQPFINATDAVLAEMLPGPTRVSDITMDDEAYQRKGIAASVAIRGDIEGHVIFDLETHTALRVAAALAEGEVNPTEQLAAETVCELANVVIGNAVTLLNDYGHSFKVYPPVLHTAEKGCLGSRDRETVVMCFHTQSGKVHLNIALDYSRQRSRSSQESYGREK